MSTSEYTIVERGAAYSDAYRLYFQKRNAFISPWHDVPLFANERQRVYNMICEIPRWTNAKMEIGTKEPLNPIRQDVKKGKVRFVDNCFPYKGYIWNYGALPQTWEDPNHVDARTGAKGDNDPIDVLEIGQRVARRGDVIQVKLLGLIALIDEGETDWKLLAVDVNDPAADRLNDIDDVEQRCKGLLKATRRWLTIYKIPAGKAANKFAMDGNFQNRSFAEDVVKETHRHWEALRRSTGRTELWRGDVANQDEAYGIVEATPVLAPPISIDPGVDKWHFVEHTD